MHQGERAFLVQRVSCTSILVLQLYVYAYFTCYVLYVCTCYLVTGRRGVLVWAAPLGGFFMLCYVALLFAVVVMLIRIQLYSCICIRSTLVTLTVLTTLRTAPQKSEIECEYFGRRNYSTT